GQPTRLVSASPHCPTVACPLSTLPRSLSRGATIAYSTPSPTTPSTNTRGPGDDPRESESHDRRYAPRSRPRNRILWPRSGEDVCRRAWRKIPLPGNARHARRGGRRAAAFQLRPAHGRAGRGDRLWARELALGAVHRRRGLGHPRPAT